MKFFIGQTFDNYPPEAASWCTRNGAKIIQKDNKNIIVKVDYDNIENKSIIINMYKMAVQQYLDSVAQSKGYDNTYTCLSYLNSTEEVWKQQANIFNSWRDQVWKDCHNYLNMYQDGKIKQIPVDQFISLLPKIQW